MALASVPEDVAPYELSSPSLLAMQPPSPKESKQQSDLDWLTLYNYLEGRLTALRNWRWSWWAFWAVLARFFRKVHALTMASLVLERSMI